MFVVCTCCNFRLKELEKDVIKKKNTPDDMDRNERDIFEQLKQNQKLSSLVSWNNNNCMLSSSIIIMFDEKSNRSISTICSLISYTHPKFFQIVLYLYNTVCLKFQIYLLVVQTHVQFFYVFD